jgi:hypothetical protein
MHLYIKTVSQKNDHGAFHDAYEFTRAIECGWNWNTEEKAELYRSVIVERGGIIASDPTGIRRRPCTDFRVESRPQGGFVIACEPNI